MANKQLSTDYTNTIRDVSNAFELIVQKIPGLLPMIGVASTPIATALKHEWLEQQSSPSTFAIAAFDTDGDGTGIQFASTTGILAGDILTFTKSTGANVSESVRVASVDSTTEITVVREYGSSTGATLVVGDIAYVSSPRYEGTSPTFNANEEGTMNYNYPQIYDRTAKISKTANIVGVYDAVVERRNSLLQNAINTQMRNLAWEKANNVYKGRRVLRAPSSSLKGTHGGFEQYITNINSTGGAIDSDLINAGFQSMFEAGATGTNYALVMNIEQRRRVSGFNTSGTNPVVYIPEKDTTGNVISRFIADFNIGDATLNGNVVLDKWCPKDEAYLLDMDQIGWAPLRTMTSEPAQNPGDDFFAVRLLEETTLEVRNGAYAHCRFTGLTI